MGIERRETENAKRRKSSKKKGAGNLRLLA